MVDVLDVVAGPAGCDDASHPTSVTAARLSPITADSHVGFIDELFAPMT